ncbi:MAG TPA: RpiB/LacA/LacB family sugar-phosphate isomerase [Candidatus Nanoarchaeia archaeon]|nr:RpiB/LacA/LacB family sugar-phosphate isomerase [Candidatus Nanoarchaeia archaeon]
MKQKKVFIGADHAGFELKEKLKRALSKTVALKDLGAYTFQKDDDYPDIAAKVARAVVNGKTKGILLCGSAEGICIAANKIKGIRAVAVWTPQNARLSREHNDANILCLSGWELSLAKTVLITNVWLKTPFSGDTRHVRRISKIANLERC